jgi:hypothetical protein
LIKRLISETAFASGPVKTIQDDEEFGEKVPFNFAFLYACPLLEKKFKPNSNKINKVESLKKNIARLD